MALGEQFSLSPEESEKLLDEMFEKMSSIFALGFRKGICSQGTRTLSEIEMVQSPGSSAPKDVTWEVTYKCNLRCPHCFTASGSARGGELNTEQAMAVIDQLEYSGVFSLLISGGEPLLRQDMPTLLQRLARTKLRVGIGTNGLEMPDNIMKDLIGLRGLHVHVSIDGIGSTHDRFRGKRGAFDLALATIQKMQEHHIDVHISTTVTPQNVGELDQIIDLSSELGCTGFQAIPFFPVGRGQKNQDKFELTRDDYRRIFTILDEKTALLRGKVAISQEMCFPFLFDGTKAGPRTDGPMYCAAGHDTLCIGADGTVYPCAFLRDFPLGNITRDRLTTLWSEAPVLRTLRALRKSDMREPCKSCDLSPSPCRGGCRAAAYLSHGDLASADPACFKDIDALSFV